MGARIGTTLGRKVNMTNGNIVRIKSGDIVTISIGIRPGTKVRATKDLALKFIVVTVDGRALKPQLVPVVGF